MTKKIEFEISTSEGPHKVKAELVDLVPWAKTAIHRTQFFSEQADCVGWSETDTFGKRYWSVSEVTTGLYISRAQPTKQLALQRAKALLEQVGEDRFQKTVNDKLKLKRVR